HLESLHERLLVDARAGDQLARADLGFDGLADLVAQVDAGGSHLGSECNGEPIVYTAELCIYSDATTQKRARSPRPSRGARRPDKETWHDPGSTSVRRGCRRRCAARSPARRTGAA